MTQSCSFIIENSSLNVLGKYPCKQLKVASVVYLLKQVWHVPQSRRPPPLLPSKILQLWDKVQLNCSLPLIFRFLVFFFVCLFIFIFYFRSFSRNSSTRLCKTTGQQENCHHATKFPVSHFTRLTCWTTETEKPHKICSVLFFFFLQINVLFPLHCQSLSTCDTRLFPNKNAFSFSLFCKIVFVSFSFWQQSFCRLLMEALLDTNPSHLQNI